RAQKGRREPVRRTCDVKEQPSPSLGTTFGSSHVQGGEARFARLGCARDEEAGCVGHSFRETESARHCR
ncbi:hypothetical protein, partial [Pelagicoccus sp. SDUM812003]|uniref:hypothetical protein n=1 Tax=Pelagicoccus sp. SDUM812003 TaxID=3041267 RepID=UPI00280D74AC